MRQFVSILTNRCILKILQSKQTIVSFNRSSYFSTVGTKSDETEMKRPFKEKYQKGPGLKDFILPELNSEKFIYNEENIPYLDNAIYSLPRKKVFFDIYGCQMNVNDTEVVWSILKKYNYLKTETFDEADIILLMTCAIRESAETKIWNRLVHLNGIKKRKSKSKAHVKIGILGCMAERLKHKLLEKEKIVDIVAGPDSYKDLPRLLAVTENNQTAINVLLSLDETYADVMPVRLDENSKFAFVSIMRGCDNMCTYCIVPFTRGRERSRPIDSIVEEVRQLSDQGVKQVTLLGQNVNSYRDLSESSINMDTTKLAKGFKTVYKTKVGGLRFADLLDQVSQIDPDMRIRFTSPHPKDFPDEVLQIIKERPNICNALNLPAQSGSSAVLERMRRGYTRETYIELVDHVRSIISGVTITSDMICGFCHETEEEFNDTLHLIEKVQFNMIYMFPYSMREKTTAHRRYTDDVPFEVKQERVKRISEAFRKCAEKLNMAQIGETQLVLIEGKSKRSDSILAGRNDGNIRVLIPATEIPSSYNGTTSRAVYPGDYVAVQILSSTSQCLTGVPLFHSSINSFHKLDLSKNVSQIKVNCRNN